MGNQVTCLIKVTAVLPLQMLSIFRCNLSSLSVTLKAFRNESFIEKKNSRCSNFCTDIGDLSSSSAYGDKVSSRIEPSELQMGLSPKSLYIKSRSFEGRVSLTFLATIWPCGPWPSKTPQKTVSDLPLKFCT